MALSRLATISYCGLSTDTKPTDCPVSSSFYETDTDESYRFNGSAWVNYDILATGGTATYVIAASNATAHVKAQADYVCDGTADDVQIQAAIDALPTGGGNVILSEGTFNLSTAPPNANYDCIVYASKDNVTLEGQGWATILKLPTGGNTACAGLLGNSRYGVEYNSYIRFANFAIDGNKANNTGTQRGLFFFGGSYITVENVYVHDCRDAGIQPYANNGAKFIFKNNYVSACSQGIYVDTVSTTIVEGNYVKDCDYFQIWLDAALDSVINGNIVEKTTAGSYGIGFSRLNQRDVVTNNRIIGTFGYGIVFRDDDDADVRDTLVANNSVVGSTVPIGSVSVPNAFGLRNVIKDNVGYVSPSEIRTASGTLTGGAANAILFAWHNPETQDIFIKKVIINITTADADAANIDCGIADDAAYTNGGTEFFNDLTGENILVYDSWVVGDNGQQTKWVLCQDSVSATDGWIVAKILTNDGTSIVGSYYIEYVGK